MLTEKQIEEVREHLNNAQNPLFYYDNDADGLCSFVLLRKFIGRGKGVAVRSFPDLDLGYARKVQELNADYIFVLDKPVISREFLEEMNKLNLPVIWIDHHDVSSENLSQGYPNLEIYNPAKNTGEDKSQEPVTYLAYKIANKKEDLWIAMAGCISDHFLPDFVSEFKKRWPEYWTDKKIKYPFDAYFGTEIGKIAIAFNFGLKDSTSNIVKLQNFLIDVKEPREIFEESGKNYDFRRKHKEIRERYDSLLEKARKNVKEKVLYFEYAGDLSISSELSNELSYMYKDKYIIVAYKKGGISNVSLRGRNVKKILANVLEKMQDASGGGHEDAVGARVKIEDLEKFRELLEKEIG